jgi:transposase-like protein
MDLITLTPGGTAMEEDLFRFGCQDPDCPDYGQRGHGNRTVCGRYGKAQRHRLLYCRTCKARFSERKGTPLFGCGPPEDKAIDLIEHLADRNGVRATARLVGVHRDTVVRYSRLVGPHARELHDELVASSPSDPRDPVRRELVVRLQEASALRPGRPGR